MALEGLTIGKRLRIFRHRAGRWLLPRVRAASEEQPSHERRARDVTRYAGRGVKPLETLH